jgi:hypothetical protein
MMLSATSSSFAPPHLSTAGLLPLRAMRPPHLEMHAVFEAQVAVVPKMLWL